MCAGCGAPIVVRQVLMGTDEPVVVSAATGCLEVSTTIYPYTSWKGSYIHTAFENAAATLSGVETAFRALKKKGLIEENVKFIAFGGDGGTYDIGLQSLSGAMERGHDMVYVCYDNEAYMNTGFQRSGATPHGAWTTTSPIGKESYGKVQNRKDLTEIMIAHGIPYVAQASPHDPRDLVRKAAKALATPGPAFLNILAPCPRGWRSDGAETIELAREAVNACYWPLFEVVDGVYNLTYRPRRKLPLIPWLKRQGRFAHLFKPGNEQTLEELEAWSDREWDKLLRQVRRAQRGRLAGGTAGQRVSAAVSSEDGYQPDEERGRGGPEKARPDRVCSDGRAPLLSGRSCPSFETGVSHDNREPRRHGGTLPLTSRRAGPARGRARRASAPPRPAPRA